MGFLLADRQHRRTVSFQEAATTPNKHYCLSLLLAMAHLLTFERDDDIGGLIVFLVYGELCPFLRIDRVCTERVTTTPPWAKQGDTSFCHHLGLPLRVERREEGGDGVGK